MSSLPAYEPSYIHSVAQLRAECHRLGLNLPVAEDLSVLNTPLSIGGRTLPNRFVALPIRAMDARPDGTPGRLTRRRALRVAAGGFGLIWIEGVEVDPTMATGTGHLRLREETVGAFAEWLAALREAGDSSPVVILQLVCSRRLGACSDEDLEAVRAAYVRCAGWAEEAGFDGVDLVCAHRGLLAASLVAHDRPGPYGGLWEERSRLIREINEAVQTAHPKLLRAARISGYDAREGGAGFGVDAEDYRKICVTEPVRLAKLLAETGVRLMQVSAASPNLRGDPRERAHQPLDHLDPPHEHPLTDLTRRVDLARAIHAAVPDVVLISDGAVWLRQWWANVAAGGMAEGVFALAGMGRGALAYPDAPKDLKEHGALFEAKTCMACYACSELHRAGGPTGCIVRDAGEYGAAWQHHQRFDPERLLAEARRCHQCEAAPCVAASPERVPYPVMLDAWVSGETRRAWDLLRGRSALPELAALVPATDADSETACIERALSGNPVALRDLQWSIARTARGEGWTGVVLPEPASGKTVAVVGGGPCGIAAAAGLLERGHAVVLYEALETLGGAPEHTYGRDRYAGGVDEVEALLEPAIACGRLRVERSIRVGETVGWDVVLTGNDAVVLATGVWQVPAVTWAAGEQVESAMDFLVAARRDEAFSISGGVAVLAGGDAAMDAARVAWRAGASPVHVVFEGDRAEMHWHMAEEWFAEERVRALMRTRPVAIRTDAGGGVCGLDVVPVDADSGYTLDVSRVINAQGLEPSAWVGNVLADAGENVFAAGGLLNGGASVQQCLAEGMAVARDVDAWLKDV